MNTNYNTTNLNRFREMLNSGATIRFIESESRIDTTHWMHIATGNSSACSCPMCDAELSDHIPGEE